MTATFTRLASLAAVLFIVLALVASAGASTKDELRDRFKARLPDVEKLKTAGKIGETFDGWVEMVKGAELDAAGEKLVTDENADRKELYAIIAKEETTAKETVTADLVAKRNGQRNLKNLKSAEWYKFEEGWKQRK